MNIYGYCRISTAKQSIDRQIRNIKAEYPTAHIVQEAYTGTSIFRPEWLKLYRILKSGDMVVFDSVSRMSRNADQFAFGPLCFYRRRSFHPEPESRLTPEEETHRFHTAQRQAILQLSALYDSACAELGTQAASIFSIHAMLLEDASLVEEVLTTIRSRHATAEYAVQAVEREFSSAFAGMDSPYMRARGADIRDIAHRVIRCLLGLKTPDPLAARSGILVSDELLPSEVLALDRRKLLGLVTRRGSVDSHTAMLLRLMKIPGLAEVEISSQDEGHAALLDGFSHSLYLDPEPQLMAELGLSPATERRPLAASL